MAEAVADLRGLSREAAYAEIANQVQAVLEGINDPIAGMATISSLVHASLGFLWTGFYRVVEPGKLLRVGPYQGSLGCLEIAFGRGVCGTAAAEKRSIVVDDVISFPGHITCDVRSRSEIVVPVFGKTGELIAVFDIDAEEVAAFADDDRNGLENLMKWFRSAE